MSNHHTWFKLIKLLFGRVPCVPRDVIPRDLVEVISLRFYLHMLIFRFLGCHSFLLSTFYTQNPILKIGFRSLRVGILYHLVPPLYHLLGTLLTLVYNTNRRLYRCTTSFHLFQKKIFILGILRYMCPLELFIKIC